jgi:hydroxypyruvate isomerase
MNRLVATCSAARRYSPWPPPLAASADEAPARARAVSKGRLKQSACRWCYNKIPLDELCSAAKQIGLVGLDLMGPNDFPTLEKYGLICTMTSSGKLTDGFCEPKFHEASIKSALDAIAATSAKGWRNIICFSGNARGIDRKTGLESCAKGLKDVVAAAEKAKVIVNMELLNSKVNHPDYMCDNTRWGVELVQKVGSPNFKLLNDIYHMQIMEGDIIRTIRDHHDAFGHYHTGGNPGRNEIDGTQELNYRAIAEAIVETGFDGFMAHEFIPKRDPLTSLAEAVTLCDV